MEQQKLSPEEQAAQDRIKAAHDRIAKATATLDAQKKVSDADREVVELELAAERAELTVKFNQELGEQGVAWDFVPVYGTNVAVRYPHHAIWQEYRDKGHPEDTAGLELLVHGHVGAGSCLIHPDQQTFTKLCKEPGKTGLLDACYVVIISLARVKEHDRGKK